MGHHISVFYVFSSRDNNVDGIIFYGDSEDSKISKGNVLYHYPPAAVPNVLVIVRIKESILRDIKHCK